VYESHFGLRRQPFGETVSPAAYVALPSQDALLRRLRYAIERGQGPAVLFGPAGSGKTLLARRLASELQATAVHLSYPAVSAADMVTYLALEFGGLPEPCPSIHAALRHLQSRLAALAASENRPLLVVDDAHLIGSVATFDAIRLLLNFTTTGPPDLSLLFVGGAEVLLELPPGLADRLVARCLVSPLTESEASTYVLGRLAAAGGQSPLFTEIALRVLYQAADGLPRRLNRLADLALLIAASQDLAVVDDRIVAIAAREFSRDAAA
jgi:type II secretory pathway predicted ATPase ExeA